ncbi:MAG: flavoprotein [Planctomycetota bacterium]|jgi:phosphopantothenoylcysteine decarboxylase/phosphopantothenate--cysteine ligase
MVKIGTNLKGLNILLGVSGGIAAYKAVDLASKLTGAGAKVNTVMTENACRFVGTTLWSKAEEFEVSHISLADWADIVVVAPATANIIGKAAGGICDGLLSTTLCACWQKPVLLAPAMNEKMWNNPAVQRNVKMVCEMGFETIGPEEGLLACGAEGVGRMSEPQDIIQRIEKIASRIQGDKT